MFLKLNHQKLSVYSYSMEFVLQCYKLTKILPDEEKFSMISQIRRAALSVHLNIAEGSSRKSDIERKRFYEIARGSMIEIDATLDVANKLGYLAKYDTMAIENAMINCFKTLSGLIKTTVQIQN
jgi:four helix bundle protein